MSTPLLWLIEDSQDDEELAILALQAAGVDWSIEIMRDGAEAVQKVAQVATGDAAAPNLVIMDLKLPKVGGIEVLERIRAADPTRLVPVVVMSSSKVPEDIERAYLAGASSYIGKPVEYTSYSETMQRVGIYWTRVNDAYGWRPV